MLGKQEIPQGVTQTRTVRRAYLLYRNSIYMEARQRPLYATPIGHLESQSNLYAPAVTNRRWVERALACLHIYTVAVLWKLCYVKYAFVCYRRSHFVMR